MKKNNMLFTILFAIYIVAGVIAIILFYTKGSYLSRELAASATARIETDTVTTDDRTVPDVPEESETEPETESEKEPETPADPQTPDVPEVPTELTDDPAGSADTADADAADTSEDESEAESEDQAVDETDSEDDGRTYYRFTVIDGVTGVRIRKTEDRNSKTVSHIDGGKSGYVLEKGDTRSKILTKKGTIGYIYNEYLTFTEIPKKDFPEEYR